MNEFKEGDRVRIKEGCGILHLKEGMEVTITRGNYDIFNDGADSFVDIKTDNDYSYHGVYARRFELVSREPTLNEMVNAITNENIPVAAPYKKKERAPTPLDDARKFLEENKKTKGVKYRHLRPNKAEAHGGGMTVAYRLSQSGHTLELGISYCNPADAWSNTIGRANALKVLLTNPQKFQYNTLASCLTGISMDGLKHFEITPTDIVRGMFGDN